MSYPDIKSFLSSCRLESYASKFVELGFDDVEFLVQVVFSSPQQIDDFVKQTNLKPGHLMKLNAAIEKYKTPNQPRAYVDVVNNSFPFKPQPIVKQNKTSIPPPGLFISSSFEYGHFMESQLDGQMEDLERSLNRLLDTGEGIESEQPITGFMKPSSALSPTLSSVSPSVSSISPTPSADSPTSAGSPPTSFVSSKHSQSSSPQKLPETFEVVKTKTSKKLKKKAAKANLGFCPEGLFCNEGLNCKLLHEKDDLLFFRNPVSKTKACTRNLGGVCDKHPDNCGYAHSSKDARCLRCRQRGHFVGQCQQTKTRPCRRKNGGVCDRDPLMCGFAHNKKDARCLSCKNRGHFYDQCPEKITS